MEERFCDRIVPTVTLATHTLNHFIFLEQSPEISAGVPDAPVAVNKKPLIWLPF